MSKIAVALFLFIGLVLLLNGCIETPGKECETDTDCFMLDCFQVQTHGVCENGRCVCPLVEECETDADCMHRSDIPCPLVECPGGYEITCENGRCSCDCPLPGGKTLVEIDPVQCLGNPWESEWLKNHDNNYAAYPRDVHTPELEQEEIEIIKEYYERVEAITIFQVNSSTEKYEGKAVCEACSCPQGYTLYLLVSESDAGRMLELGYAISGSGGKPPITIKTDEEEYAQGEGVKLTAEVEGEFYKWLGVRLLKKIRGEWESARSGYCESFECGSERSCEDFAIEVQLVPPLCTKLESGILTVWNQETCITQTPVCEWEGEPAGTPHCGVNLNAEASTYKFSLRYWLDENCEGDSFEVESNEFTIKAPQEIVELCEEERQEAEEQMEMPECEGVESYCVDGWVAISYYDERLVGDGNIPEAGTSLSLPEELGNGVIAEYSRSSCSCTKPIGYSILSGGELVETECESFYTFEKDYNSVCDGCVKTWGTSCC